MASTPIDLFNKVLLLHILTCTYRLSLIAITESPTDCWDGCSSFLYNGTISITSTGLSCRPWPESSPLAGEEAYCRDYEVDGLGQPWCYTTDPYNEYDFCDIPVCSCKYYMYYLTFRLL